MASYALIKFKINNDFSEWEQAYYGAQPMARKAGIIELFHGMTEDDPQPALYWLMCLQKKPWINSLRMLAKRLLSQDIF